MEWLGPLLALIIFAVIMYVIRLVLPMLGLPAPINTAILVVVGLVFVIWLFGTFLGVGPLPLRR